MANSSAGNCADYGTQIDDGYNLTDDATCSFLTSPTDSTNTPAGLDPSRLKDNGGPTKTIALLSTSPAVDAIPVANCTDVNGHAITTDQRGFLRPQGPGCDIGAYEYATATSAVQSLINYVESLGLAMGAEQSLSASLYAALDSLNRGDNGTADNQLNAFLNKVSSDEQNGRLTAQQAAQLVAQVQLILKVLVA